MSIRDNSSQPFVSLDQPNFQQRLESGGKVKEVHDIAKSHTKKNSSQPFFYTQNRVNFTIKNPVCPVPAVGHSKNQSNAIVSPDSTVISNATMLLDLFIRKSTGEKYLPPKDHSLKSPKEHIESRIDPNATYVVNNFKKIVKDTYFAGNMSEFMSGFKGAVNSRGNSTSNNR